MHLLNSLKSKMAWDLSSCNSPASTCRQEMIEQVAFSLEEARKRDLHSLMSSPLHFFSCHLRESICPLLGFQRNLCSEVNKIRDLNFLLCFIYFCLWGVMQNRALRLYWWRVSNSRCAHKIRGFFVCLFFRKKQVFLHYGDMGFVYVQPLA